MANDAVDAIRSLTHGIPIVQNVGEVFAEALKYGPDLTQSTADVMEGIYGVRIGSRNPAVEQALQQILPKLARGEDVTLIGYSQGGAIVDAIVERIERNPDYRKYLGNIKVATMGSAGRSFPNGLGGEQHIQNLTDPVPRIADVLTPDFLERRRNVKYTLERGWDTPHLDAIGHDYKDYVVELDVNELNPY